MSERMAKSMDEQCRATIERQHGGLRYRCQLVEGHREDHKFEIPLKPAPPAPPADLKEALEYSRDEGNPVKFRHPPAPPAAPLVEIGVWLEGQLRETKADLARAESELAQLRRDWEHTDHMLKRSEERAIRAETENQRLREALQAVVRINRNNGTKGTWLDEAEAALSEKGSKE